MYVVMEGVAALFAVDSPHDDAFVLFAEHVTGVSDQPRRGTEDSSALKRSQAALDAAKASGQLPSAHAVYTQWQRTHGGSSSGGGEASMVDVSDFGAVAAALSQAIAASGRSHAPTAPAPLRHTVHVPVSATAMAAPLPPAALPPLAVPTSGSPPTARVSSASRSVKPPPSPTTALPQTLTTGRFTPSSQLPTAPGEAAASVSAVPTTATPRPVIDTSRLWAHLRVAFRALVATLTALHVAEDLAKRVRYLSDGRTISQLQLVRRGQVFGELELVFGSRRTWWSVWSETRELNLWPLRLVAASWCVRLCAGCACPDHRCVINVRVCWLCVATGRCRPGRVGGDENPVCRVRHPPTGVPRHPRGRARPARRSC